MQRKKWFLMLALLLIASALHGGIHVSGKAPAFAMKNLSVSAPAEFEYAAKKAAEILGRIYKVTVPVSEKGNITFVQDTKYPDQGFNIKSSKSGVVISAGNARGANFAVAALARELGYRFFFPTPEWEVFPENPPASLAIDLTESPDYLSRRISSGHGGGRSIRKATNSDENWKLFNFLGGLRLNTAHAYGNFIKHNRDTFKAHPEYYALRNGKRDGSKLCISNPELRKLFVNYCLTILKNNPQTESISVEPSDGGGWCECENCQKLGIPSSRAVLLANEVAKAVIAKYPDKKIGMYAYNQHCRPPEISPHPAVIVSVATSLIRGGYHVDELINGWKARNANIGIREYYFARPAPTSGRAGNTAYINESLKRFYQSGARYIIAQSYDAWGTGGLGYYCGAQIMWNTALTAEELKADFLQKAFPNSLEPMKKFYELIEGSSPKALNRDLLGRMYRYLDEAGKTASIQEKKRINALICYTRFNEICFTRNAGKWDDYRNLMLFAASIRRTRMLDVHAIFRGDYRLCPKNMSRKPLNIDMRNLTSPSEADLQRFVTEGIKNNPLLDFDIKSFSDDLVVLNNPQGTAEMDAGVNRRRVIFYIWCDGKPFTITVTGGLIAYYRDRGNVELQLVQIGGESDTGELETVVHYDRSVPPDGKPYKVVLKPKHPGLHKVIVDDHADRTRILWPGHLAIARPVAREKSPELNGTFYFYVPQGTKLLGFYAKTSRGSINDPSGKAVFKLRKRNGYYTIPLKPEQCGKIWKLNKMSGTVKLLTVPSNLSLHSSKILIPREVKEGK